MISYIIAQSAAPVADPMTQFFVSLLSRSVETGMLVIALWWMKTQMEKGWARADETQTKRFDEAQAANKLHIGEISKRADTCDLERARLAVRCDELQAQIVKILEAQRDLRYSMEPPQTHQSDGNLS